MATLTTSQKAPVLDGDGTPLLTTGSTVTTSDPAVCGLANFDDQWWAVAQSPGTCTLTANRSGSTASLEVTVVAEPFSIQLGAPEPK